MWPSPLAISFGSSALVTRSVPSTLVSHIQRQSSSSASATGSSPRAPPALFTSTRHASMPSQNAWTEAASVTSSSTAVPSISAAIARSGPAAARRAPRGTRRRRASGRSPRRSPRWHRSRPQRLARSCPNDRSPRCDDARVTLDFLDADGVRLAVRSWGAGPPIVLLHGWGQSSRAWQRLAPLLPGFRLVAPDLRGHGASDVPDVRLRRPGRVGRRPRRGARLRRTRRDRRRLVLRRPGAHRPHPGARHAGCAGSCSSARSPRSAATGRAGASAPLMRGRMPADAVGRSGRRGPALTAFVRGMAGGPVPGRRSRPCSGRLCSVPPRSARPCSAATSAATKCWPRSTNPPWSCTAPHDRVIDPAAAEHTIGKIPGATGRWFLDGGPCALRRDRRRSSTRCCGSSPRNADVTRETVTR